MKQKVCAICTRPELCVILTHLQTLSSIKFFNGENVEKVYCKECNNVIDVIEDATYYGEGDYWHKECSPPVNLQEITEGQKFNGICCTGFDWEAILELFGWYGMCHNPDCLIETDTYYRGISCFDKDDIEMRLEKCQQ